MTIQQIKQRFSIIGNSPNPFNPSTIIKYFVKNSTDISLIIFNSKGQKVKTLVHEFKENGNYSVIWNGLDESGNPVTSGLYFAGMITADKDGSSGKFTSIKKLLLLK